MVISVIARIVQRLGSQGFRQLYRAVNYQDKIIDKSWSYARIAKPIRQGVRHGAAGGALTGTFLKELLAPDSPGNEFQKPFQKRQRITPSKPYQTRQRFSVRCPPRRAAKSTTGYRNRRTYSR